MYPMLKEGVTLERCRFKNEKRDHYYATNRAGRKYEINRLIYCALLRADGNKPLCLPNKGLQVLPLLKKADLVQTTRFVKEKGVFNRFILFPIKKSTQETIRPFCKAINSVLPILSVVTFIIGLYYIKTSNVELNNDLHWFWYIGLLATSIALHEVGHLVAGIAYGYRITDVGLLLLSIIPLGAYVAYKERKNVPRFKAAQFSLAGVEMNILIAGVCLLLSQLNYSLSLTLVLIATANVLMSCINGLFPAFGLDGEQALGALIGVPNLSKSAKKFLFNKNNRKKLLHTGISGKMYFCIFSFCMISKILFILVYTSINLVSILSAFL